jgi:hypothetical protein
VRLMLRGLYRDERDMCRGRVIPKPVQEDAMHSREKWSESA